MKYCEKCEGKYSDKVQICDKCGIVLVVFSDEVEAETKQKKGQSNTS